MKNNKAKINDLKCKRKALWEEAKAVIEHGNNPKTGMVDKASVDRCESKMAEIKEIDGNIRILEDMQEIDRNIHGDDRVSHGSSFVGSDRDSASDKSGMDGAYSATDSKAYTNAFKSMIRGQESITEVRDALSAGITTEGGYTVPDEFDKKLIKGLNDHNVIRRLAKVEHTRSGMHKIPVLSGEASVAWVDESTPIPETGMEYGRITFSAYKMGAVLKVTNEYLRETALDIEDHITDSFCIAVGKEEEKAFINGTGIKQATGLLHETDGAGIGAITEKAGDVSMDDVIRLYYSLDGAYRKDAVFLCNEDLMMRLMLLKDGNGNYIWKPSLEVGKPDTLLGKPVYTSNAMPELKAGNKVLLWGDFSYYWITERGRRTFRRLDELFSVEGQTGFMLTQRLDAKLVLKDAMKVLKVNG